jgi:NAD-dependent deacetylase
VTDTASLVAQAGALLREAQAAVAFTGAGVSTPSGIPDFRSPGSGLWENVDPMEVASLSSFRYHPERFYAWVRPLAATMQGAKPNPAHRALAALEMAVARKRSSPRTRRTHQRAGASTLSLYGSLRDATCGQCTRLAAAHAGEVHEDDTVPHCQPAAACSSPT